MGLQLRLRELYAEDETNTAGTEWGSDDMFLGVVALELRGPRQNPTVHKIPPFKVGEFDDGDRVTYNPPRVIDNYGFGPNVFPKKIAVTFLLAEKDGGDGLKKSFEELYRKVEEQGKRIKADAAGSTSSGEKGGMDWAVVLAFAYKVGNEIYDTWKGDEIFEPKVESLSVESEAHRWRGRTTSAVEKIIFRGHKGRYRLTYDWRMER